MNIYSQYLGDVFNPDRFGVTYEWTKRVLSEFKYDAIAFRGTSGAALAFPLSLELQVPLIHVRKHKGHSYNIVEGMFDCCSYVIIDDCVCSGGTLIEIRDRINAAPRTKKVAPYCAGVIFYYCVAQDTAAIKKDKVRTIFPNATIVFRGYSNEQLEFRQK